MATGELAFRQALANALLTPEGGLGAALAGLGLPPRPGMLNFTRANLPVTARRLQRVAANAGNTGASPGVNNFRIQCDGDSLTRSPSDLWPQVQFYGSSQQRAVHVGIANALRAAGFPSNTDAICGVAIYTNVSGFSANNGMINIPTSWTVVAQDTAGGSFLECGATITDPLTITPRNAYDTVEVCIYLNTSNSHTGKLTATVGGTTSAEAGGTFTGIYRLSIAVPAQAGGVPFTLQRSSGGAVYLLSVRTRLSTLGEVEIDNCGRNSGTSSTLVGTATPYSPQNMLAVRTPHLVIDAMGVNDWNPPTSATSVPVTSLATFIANTQTRIDAVKAVGADMILVGAPQSNAAGSGISSNAVQAQYIDAKRTLALTNNLPWIDFTELWGGYTSACAREMMARIDNGSGGTKFDDKHLSIYGADNWGRTIGRAILNAVLN